MVRLIVAATASLAVSGVLSACTTEDERGPEQFRDRTPLPACATVELAQGESVSRGSQACLDAALGGSDGAELTVGAPTREGDRVVFYYRVVPGQVGYDVFVDSTEDKFGSGAWSVMTCPDAVSVQDLGSCNAEELD